MSMLTEWAVRKAISVLAPFRLGVTVERLRKPRLAARVWELSSVLLATYPPIDTDPVVP